MSNLLSDFIVSPIRVEGSVIHCQYRFTPDFVGFSGHFPDYPILPAFVQILMGLDLLSRLRGIKQGVAAIENAKFRIEIRPGDDIFAQCSERTAGHKTLYEVRLTVGGGLASSFLLFPENGKEGDTC